MNPIKKSPGLSKTVNKFICNPIVATKIYIKIVPILEAPTPSKSLNLVNERITPKVVAITINQKKLDVKLYFSKIGKLFNRYGAILSAIK